MSKVVVCYLVLHYVNEILQTFHLTRIQQKSMLWLFLLGLAMLTFLEYMELCVNNCQFIYADISY